MQYKRIWILPVILLVVWMSVIFGFSAQPVKQSVGLSEKVGRIISETVVPGFHSWPEQKQEKFVKNIDFGVRKAAHFTEYMFLGMLWILFFHSLLKSRYGYKKEMLFSFLASAAFASGDEFHQLFVAGRHAKVQDVCIDTAGATIGILIISLILRKIVGGKKKNG